ncbi:uncharacterized protein F4807DRAFT_419747 [Annulohypoxylon truncatum]|uniref:uncharacterized protein n=1 Tax=Annulohypoxylon truncatum TaxID=327061 RepID=UPI002007A96D|nr:uncharacterized protein F4807DRAFT_419747 [Annulohypoxylon truncatum]KAI1211296.1 hypothetical protein F4807DRAFT_419747 [Annulohypoxylon truncatum]
MYLMVLIHLLHGLCFRQAGSNTDRNESPKLPTLYMSESGLLEVSLGMYLGGCPSQCLVRYLSISYCESVRST